MKSRSRSQGQGHKVKKTDFWRGGMRTRFLINQKLFDIDRPNSHSRCTRCLVMLCKNFKVIGQRSRSQQTFEPFNFSILKILKSMHAIATKPTGQVYNSIVHAWYKHFCPRSKVKVTRSKAKFFLEFRFRTKSAKRIIFF